jgi:hypothetical protein
MSFSAVVMISSKAYRGSLLPAVSDTQGSGNIMSSWACL